MTKARPLSAGMTKTRLVRGDRILMEMRDGARQWWFEGPYAAVSDKVMRRLIERPQSVRLVEAGDSLFGMPANSQTWTPVADGEPA